MKPGCVTIFSDKNRPVVTVEEGLQRIFATKLISAFVIRIFSFHYIDMHRMMKKFNVKGLSTKFREECLRSHNKYRAIHGSPGLSLSPEINAYAQEWANHLAEDNVFEHRPDCGYGENLFTAFETNPKWTVQPSDPVKAWYSEIELYTFDETAVPKIVETGHFTQVIWKGTRYLGVGISFHPSRRVYIVCDYDPPGNDMGEFNENVLPPRKVAKYNETFIWKRAIPSCHNYKVL